MQQVNFPKVFGQPVKKNFVLLFIFRWAFFHINFTLSLSCTAQFWSFYFAVTAYNTEKSEQFIPEDFVGAALYGFHYSDCLSVPFSYI